MHTHAHTYRNNLMEYLHALRARRGVKFTLSQSDTKLVALIHFPPSVAGRRNSQWSHRRADLKKKEEDTKDIRRRGQINKITDYLESGGMMAMGFTCSFYGRPEEAQGRVTMSSSQPVDVFHPKFLLSTTVCSLMGRVGFCVCVSLLFLCLHHHHRHHHHCIFGCFVFMNQVSALPLSVAPNDNDRAHPYDRHEIYTEPKAGSSTRTKAHPPAGYFEGGEKNPLRLQTSMGGDGRVLRPFVPR